MSTGKTLLIVIIGAILGGLFGWWGATHQSRLHFWKRIGKFPEENARQLVAPPPGYIVCVETESAHVYCLERKLETFYRNGYQYTRKIYAWKALSPKEMVPRREEDACIRPANFDVPSPPGKVVDEIVVESCMYAESASETRYALLANMSVWEWHYSANAFGTLVWAQLLCVGGVMGGALLSAILAISIKVMRATS